MSHKKKNQSSILQKFAVGLVGVGIGFLVNAIFKEVTKQDKQVAIQNSAQEVKTQPKNDNIKRTSMYSYDKIQQCMTCPITQQIMRQPSILTSCGHVFQKSVIKKWVNQNQNCPLCKAEAHLYQIKDNFHLREIIQHYQLGKNGTKTAKQQQK